jgi:sigma-B regulation protein RsbU (phosphoserine phosphatase)
MPSAPFDEGSVSLKPGDTLLIFSDGITEAMNINEDEFGDEKLIRLIKENLNESAEKIIEIVFQEVKNFTGNIPQSDDMTLVILKRDNNPE